MTHLNFLNVIDHPHVPANDIDTDTRISDATVFRSYQRQMRAISGYCQRRMWTQHRLGWQLEQTGVAVLTFSALRVLFGENASFGHGDYARFWSD